MPKRKKEEYENLINNSPVFEINRNESPSLYQTERRKLFDYLVEYYKDYIFCNKNLETYEYELIVTANDCLKSYRKENGAFLNYFNSSMKFAMAKYKAKEKTEELRAGLRFSNREEALIRKIILYADSKHLDLNLFDDVKQIALAFGLDADKVLKLIKANDEMQVKRIESSVTSGDDEAVDPYSAIPSKELSPDEQYAENDNYLELINAIDSVYQKVQERSKPIVSAILTVKLLAQFDYDAILARSIFFNKAIANSYMNSGQVPTMREISARCGVSEQSANRTYHTFMLKVKQRINN